MAKKRENKKTLGDGLLTECPCGNSDLVVPTMTLVLHNVPIHEITEDGPQYDDMEAEQSEGWDWAMESEVKCRSCGAIYDMQPAGLSEEGTAKLERREVDNAQK